jgi:tetratricopeptide (TPR) repeat protein
MHKTAKTSRFLIDFSSSGDFADSENTVSDVGLLQHIVVNRLAYAANSRQLFNELAQRLIRLAERAFSLRDMNSLQETSRVLVSLPLTKARQIGQYYLAIAISRIGQTDEALSLLEAVADNAPLVYRARAIQTMGSIYHRRGCHDEAMRLYPEALRVASLENGRDLLTTLMVHLEISCIKSETGDHKGALADYESVWPLVHIVGRQNPLYFYLYHNELAIEFAELGRIAESEAACAIALASPFSPAYPEWSDTRDELASKRDSATLSVVAFSRARGANPSQQVKFEPKRHRARVITLRRTAQKKDSVQRSIILIAALTAIFYPGITQSILDWMRKRIGPRAPTTFS